MSTTVGWHGGYRSSTVIPWSHVGTDRMLPTSIERGIGPLVPCPVKPKTASACPAALAPTTHPVIAAQRRISLAELVCASCDLTLADIRGRSRLPHVSAARHLTVAMLVAAGDTCSAVGRFLGRDHATVSHSLHQVARTPDLATRFADLKARGLPHAISLQEGIDHALLVFDLPTDRQVRAFLYADLLGEAPRRAYQDLWRYGGVRALAAHPEALARVRAALAAHERYGALCLLDRAVADVARRAV